MNGISYSDSYLNSSSIANCKSSNKKNDYWSFIEEYYPSYHSSDDILLSDMLHRFLTMKN